MGWDGMRWDGMAWGGMGWARLVWSGLVWAGMKLCCFTLFVFKTRLFDIFRIENLTFRHFSYRKLYFFVTFRAQNFAFRYCSSLKLDSSTLLRRMGRPEEPSWLQIGSRLAPDWRHRCNSLCALFFCDVSCHVMSVMYLF